MFKVVSPSRGLGFLQIGALIGGFVLIVSALFWNEDTAEKLIIYFSILILGINLGSAWRGANEEFQQRNFSVGNGEVTYTSIGQRVFWTWLALNTLRLLGVLFFLPGTFLFVWLIKPYTQAFNLSGYSVAIAVAIYWAVGSPLVFWLFPKYDRWRDEKERLLDPVAWTATRPTAANDIKE